MQSPRTFELSGEARMALGQILGIMTDAAMSGGMSEGLSGAMSETTSGDMSGAMTGSGPRWDLEHVLELEMRLDIPTNGSSPAALEETSVVTIGIDDAALLLDGMAFTEIASADLPWIEMVRWTADFITTELRQHWTDDEWRALASR
ncbi:MAG: hypothetical protein AAFY28_07820 [Actinomycetota bacterium]